MILTFNSKKKMKLKPINNRNKMYRISIYGIIISNKI